VLEAELTSDQRKGSTRCWKLEPASAPWGLGATIDEVDGAVSVLEFSWRLVSLGESLQRPQLREPLELPTLPRSS
jgi:hypothetical protein